MMKRLVSVIVPVDKVEHYLSRCLDSIVTQSYKNIEIILVDDGSPDKCGIICDEYAKRDPRIRVIHKENGGLSDARNCGVEIANGAYITFIDSDDYIAPNYIEYLYNLAVENDADISCCCSVKTSDNTVAFDTKSEKQKPQVLSGRETCFALFGALYLTLVTAWGKLYKESIVKKYPFPKGRKHEDEGTTYKYYYEATKVVVGDAQLYAYYQNPSGIMHSLPKGFNHDLVWTHEQRALFFKKQEEPELEKAAWGKLYHQCVNGSIVGGGCYDDYLRSFNDGKPLSRKVKRELKLYNTSPKAFKIYKDCINALWKIKRFIIYYGRK